jgi:hypothetical protein
VTVFEGAIKLSDFKVIAVSLPKEVVLWLEAVRSLSGENRSAIVGYALLEFMERYPGVTSQVVALRKG